MNKTKNTKNCVKFPVSSSKTNIQRLQKVTRTMLDRLEQALAMPVSDGEEKTEQLKKSHELLFGPKASLADTLISLAELVFKLEDAENTAKESGGAAVATRLFSDADAALIEAFLCRVRHPDAGGATSS